MQSTIESIEQGVRAHDQYQVEISYSGQNFLLNTAERMPMKDRPKKPLLLPWWFIFVGYGLAFLSIGSVAFFTLLYSLEWGATTSLNWLMALLFSTSSGTLLFEPIKVRTNSSL